MQRNRGKQQNGKDQKSLQEIEYIKGIFHAKMGIVKDRNGKDLTEAEKIKNGWQEYTEELYKKVLMTWITLMVWSLTQSQTAQSVKLTGPQKA